jgi:hypothetical protein
MEEILKNLNMISELVKRTKILIQRDTEPVRREMQRKLEEEGINVALLGGIDRMLLDYKQYIHPDGMCVIDGSTREVILETDDLVEIANKPFYGFVDWALTSQSIILSEGEC